MPHPAYYAITIGVAIGAALLAFFVSREQQQPHTHHPHKPDPNYDPNSWSRGLDTTPRPITRKRNSSSKNPCLICFDDMKHDEESPVVVLSCAHKFHKKCIQEWWKINKNCPTCRTQA